MTDSTCRVRSHGPNLSRASITCAPRRAPGLLLGGGPRFDGRVAAHFREAGWVVHTAACGAEVLTLALRKNPAAVVLPTDVDGESGFLTCAKLRHALPGVRVVLVGPTRTPGAERLAGFLGAAFAAETDDPAEWTRVVAG